VGGGGPGRPPRTPPAYASQIPSSDNLTVLLSCRILVAVSPKDRWKLADLAAEAGVSPRTVRYYVQRGLLPPPTFRGPDTSYGREHLLRLKAIRRLQARYLPLDEIQRELAGLGEEELERLADGKHGGPGAREPEAGPDRAVPSAHPPPDPSAGRVPVPRPQPPRAPAPPAPPASPTPGAEGRAYRRIELLPGLELHLGADADERTVRWAERILRAAREEGERR
jgi:DNA-binding transcriptional MerR regulator